MLQPIPLPLASGAFRVRRDNYSTRTSSPTRAYNMHRVFPAFLPAILCEELHVRCVFILYAYFPFTAFGKKFDGGLCWFAGREILDLLTRFISREKNWDFTLGRAANFAFLLSSESAPTLRRPPAPLSDDKCHHFVKFVTFARPPPAPSSFIEFSSFLAIVLFVLLKASSLISIPPFIRSV